MDAAQQSERGVLIRRALDLRGALKLGIHITMDDVRADEFYTMLIIEDERDKFDREKTNPNGEQQPTRTRGDGRGR